MQVMEPAALRGELIRSLQGIYHLNAFSALADLLQGESLVLQELLEHRGEAASPSVLSERLHLSRSRITGTLNSLRRKGLIVTTPFPRDHRRLQVRITEAGAAEITRQLEEMHAYFDRMLAGLGPEDAAALIGLIDRCVSVMED